MNSILSKSRYLVLVAVVSSLIASAVTFLWGTYKTILVSKHLVLAMGGEAHKIRVEAISIMDIFLIAVALLIFALGLFELFIGKLDLPGWFAVSDLDDLKDRLRAVIIFVMIVTFLEHLVLWQDPQSILMFAGAIAIIIVALVVTVRFGRRNSLGTGSATVSDRYPSKEEE